MTYIMIALIAYLIGSIPTALIVGKKHNVDIRHHGSGNLGGTNTFRVLGKKAGFTVSIVDISKGFVATLIGLLIGRLILGESLATEGAAVAALMVSIGHAYPIFAQFRGGKSVSTGAGAMLVLSPQILLFGIIVFVIVLFTTRIVSLSSITAALTVLIVTVIIDDSWLVRLLVLLLALFIIYRHRSNIERIINGKEARANLFGKK